MAATGYTPISLYYSSTATTLPLAANLISGELAINITDGKLYYKDNTGAVQLLASKSTTAGAVTAISVATANGLTGVSSGGTTPSLTLGTTITGIVKGNGTALSAAVSGTDYAPATSGSAILKGNGAGGFSNATAGTDYAPATSGTSILYGDGAGGFSPVTIGSGITFSTGTLSATGSGGTVTAVSVASANGFTGTSSGGATPALTLATSVTGLLKGNGTAISAATSGTDYAPATSGTAILYGNGSGGFSSVTIGSNLTFAGGTLSATGGGGGITTGKAIAMAMIFGF